MKKMNRLFNGNLIQKIDGEMNNQAREEYES